MQVPEDFELIAPPLPHDLAAPLHILDFDRIAWALTALGALLLLLLARYLWRRVFRPALEQRSMAPGQSVLAPEVATGIGGDIGKLLERHLAAGSYRQGCHELAQLLRGHFQGAFRQPYTTYTVGEIVAARRPQARRPDGGPVGSLFRRLEELQFRRDEPDGDDLRSVCERATDVAGKAR